MKRKIVAVVLASTMVFGMTACGSSGASDSSSTGSDAATDDTATDDGSEEANVTEGSSDDENTLTVWTWDPNFNIYAIEKAAEIYAKDHPGFKVDVSEIKSDDIETRLTTAVSAGDLSTLPDIFLMQDNSFQKYATNYPDVFTDLTDSGIDFSQFSSAKVAYSTLDGKNYGIPFDNGAVIECLRTDMLEEAGYTVDDFTDITWSDFMEKAKVVKEKTGQPILTSQAGSPDLVMEMLQSCGESLFNEDGSVNIKDNKALKPILEIYQLLTGISTSHLSTTAQQLVLSTDAGSWLLS